MIIYTVVADWCEDTWIIRLYSDELSAFKFSKACNDYDKQWTEEPNKTAAREEEWNRSHPASSSHNATIMHGCSYDIEEHELMVGDV